MSNRKPPIGINLGAAIRLGDGRWTVPVLALIAARDGARAAELARSLGVTRSSLARTLDHLSGCGWIARNPGHGHPLRPEYILTPEGRPVARRARALAERYAELDLAPGALPRWSLPVVVELAPAARRFNELLQPLAPATPRALSLTIKGMMASDLVSRDIVDDFPPIPLYALTSRGEELAQAL